MRTAVVDIGSNTGRLLVAESRGVSIEPVYEQKTYLGLGEEIERRGRISGAKLAGAAQCVRKYVRAGHKLGAGSCDVIVTAPGRQSANAAALLAALERAAGAAAVRVLSPDEEGRLAYEGAVVLAEGLPESIAVCDVGGGSTEVVVGTRSAGPAWSRSLDIGSLRLTSRCLGDDLPGKRALEAAREELERAFEGFVSPLPQAALAAGGTARALRRIVGWTLGAAELDDALRLLTKRSASGIAQEFGIDLWRARTLAGGTLILAEVQRRLAIPFEVARGGLREGAAAARLSELAAA